MKTILILLTAQKIGACLIGKSISSAKVPIFFYFFANLISIVVAPQKNFANVAILQTKTFNLVPWSDQIK